MVRVAKFLGYTLFFLVALMFFTPKVSLYYFAEQHLEKYGVVIGEEKASDGGLTLVLKDGVVFVKGIDGAHFEEVQITLFGVYNSVDVENVELASAAQNFVPATISNISLTHHIFSPTTLHAKIDGEFGEADAQIDLLERKLTAVLKPSELMKKQFSGSLRNLAKNQDGEYSYEQSF